MHSSSSDEGATNSALRLSPAGPPADAHTCVVAVGALEEDHGAHAGARHRLGASPLCKGAYCSYTSADGTTHVVTVHKVHFDDPQPYYTIRFADGNERETVCERLVPCPASLEHVETTAKFVTPR